MENEIEAAIVAATAGKTQEAPVETGKPTESPAKTESTVVPTNEGKVVENPATPEKKQKLEWDGDVNKLPPDLQDWAKASQRKFTEQAMAYAELRRKGEEFTQLQQSEEWKKFQESKTGAKPVEKAPEAPTGITADEWEEAQLDSTGTVANKLIQREVDRKIQEAAQRYGSSIEKIEQKNNMTDFKTALSDFTELHPDIIELHEDGLIKPLLDAEMKSGAHKDHVSAINAAYEKGSQIAQKSKARALKAAQGRVAEKKDAVVATGVSTGDATHYEVNSKGDVLDKALEFAAQGKKIKVRSKS